MEFLRYQISRSLELAPARRLHARDNKKIYLMFSNENNHVYLLMGAEFAVRGLI